MTALPAPRIQRQFSSGGIVFRKRGKGISIVLIARGGSKRVWCLPKGLVEKWETVRAAALREVREETGVTGTIVRKIGDIQYLYASSEERIRFIKKVSFFLIRYERGSVKDHDFEVDTAAWVPLKKALLRLTYPTERSIVQKAKTLL